MCSSQAAGPKRSKPRPTPFNNAFWIARIQYSDAIRSLILSLQALTLWPPAFCSFGVKNLWIPSRQPSASRKGTAVPGVPSRSRVSCITWNKTNVCVWKKRKILETKTGTNFEKNGNKFRNPTAPNSTCKSGRNALRRAPQSFFFPAKTALTNVPSKRRRRELCSFFHACLVVLFFCCCFFIFRFFI